jgi:hypothetical protein
MFGGNILQIFTVIIMILLHISTNSPAFDSTWPMLAGSQAFHDPQGFPALPHQHAAALENRST